MNILNECHDLRVSRIVSDSEADVKLIHGQVQTERNKIKERLPVLMLAMTWPIDIHNAKTSKTNRPSILMDRETLLYDISNGMASQY